MKMTTNRYSFKLKSELPELKISCRHLTHFSQVYGLSDTILSEINICLDELFTNIVLHGFRMDDIWYERKRGENRLTLKKIFQATNYRYKSNKSNNIQSNYFR